MSVILHFIYVQCDCVWAFVTFTVAMFSFGDFELPLCVTALALISSVCVGVIWGRFVLLEKYSI